MSKMIELHDIDVPGFLSVLDSCEGNVYLMNPSCSALTFTRTKRKVSKE